MTFTYRLNAIPGNPAPFCKLVTGSLIDSDKIIRVPPHWTAPQIFQTEAQSISEADALYFTATGSHPSRQPNVGCSIAP